MRQIDIQQPFWTHLDQLRSTLIRCLIVITLSFALALYFHQTLFQFLTAPIQPRDTVTKEAIRYERIHNHNSYPLTYELPPNSRLLQNHEMRQTTITIPSNTYVDIEKTERERKLVIFGPLEGFLTILRICFWVGLVTSSPIWLFLIFRYISPALHGDEKKRICPFLLFTLMFLCIGFFFAYHFTIPLANHFFTNFNLTVGENLWSLNHYLNYTIILLLSNGLAFELLVVLGFLVHYGAVSVDTLVKYRRHIYVCIFILSAVLTPPDVLTQLMLAIPMIVLYECLLAYFKGLCSLFRSKR